MIALVDCNNFYVSCERVFNPSLNHKPVIVLSNNDGCAISRSEEAKALGIEMAAPAFLMEDLLARHKVVVLSSNYTLYGDMSNRVMAILSSFVPAIEIYSIDEAFLDLRALKYEEFELLANRIRNVVFQNTGIPVGIGIAPTKTLAKLANRFGKKNGKSIVCIDSQEKMAQVLKATEIGGIWGIGRQYEKLLTLNNILTAYDLIRTPEEWIRKKLSVVGQRMVHELKGTSTLQWEENPERKKNICTSRSFKEYLTELKDIEEALANHVATCALKLRAENSCARTMNVFIHTNPFAQTPQHYPSVNIDLPIATNSTSELLRYAMKALRLAYRKGYNYQKAGVVVMNLVPDAAIQSGMFDRRDRERDEKLHQVLDGVNHSFGRNKLRFGVQGFGTKWKLKAEKLSPCYTTRLSDVLTVRI